MNAHLTQDEQIDAVEATLGPDRSAHLATCEACRDEVTRLRETLAAARTVQVPEPSPLFWEHQASRVAELVAADPVERPRSAWTYAAWVGSAAAVVAVGLLFVRPASPPVSPPSAARIQPDAGRVAAVPTLDVADERAWTLVEHLGDQIDADAAADALPPARGAADRALDDLDADEQAELVRVLQRELKGKPG